MKKGENISVVRKRLWRIFSEYIRLRDLQGVYPHCVGICISCKTLVTYPNNNGRWQAGHYMPRSKKYLPLYFHETNVNGQCRNCNRNLEGDKSNYRKAIIKKYGKTIVEYLESPKALVRPKDSLVELYYKIQMYKDKVRILKEIRGIK